MTGLFPKDSKALLDEKADVYEEGLRTTEMSERSRWFTQTRWYATGLCFLGSLWAALPSLNRLHKCTIDYRYFLAVAILLAVSNLIYVRVERAVTVCQPSKEQMCRFLGIQMLTDFMALSLLTYGLGGVETPILILFLPHIILSALFFSRSDSFIITWFGIFFAALPMVLEYLRLVSTLSIFDEAHKVSVISSNGIITSGYILGIAAAFLVCWYLVSDIASVLLLRERQLGRAFNRLKLLDQEKSQITLRATHELKAPFAAIKSYVYTLRDGYCGVLPDKAQQVVVRIGERCDMLMEKISDIIHLSNLRTATQANVGLTETDLMVIIPKELEDARLIGKHRGIEVQFRSDKMACPILASRDHLSTMISNLLRNAVNYSKDGGVVEVSLEAAEGKVLLHVRDHGIGIPAEHQSKIFEEHFRSNNAVRFNPNSSGMGLALVREIVRLHNGDIRVSSQLGEGSCFTVTFAQLQ
ncbi:MAG: HAMP domain-containing histidine kinase [Magnetococcales bacterium]|nr:HAMP domain-containing histidine kinase [Magnetococcales bacterium]